MGWKGLQTGRPIGTWKQGDLHPNKVGYKFWSLYKAGEEREVWLSEEKYEKKREYMREYWRKKTKYRKAQRSRWRAGNRERLKEVGKERRKLIAHSSYAIYDREIDIYYDSCAELNESIKMAGGTEVYEVDHIRAINAKDCCGLHVPWNMQLLPKSVNCQKGARHRPDIIGIRDLH